MLSKSLALAVTTVFNFEVVVCRIGRTVVTLKDTPEVAALVRLMMFRETMALCSMFPVGNDFEVTLTYCGAPMSVALGVRDPKPNIVPAVPCDMTVLNVPVFDVIGIL